MPLKLYIFSPCYLFRKRGMKDVEGEGAGVFDLTRHGSPITLAPEATLCLLVCVPFTKEFQFALFSVI